MLALSILAALVVLGAITLGNSLKIVKQYERGIIFRFGRVTAEPKRPGLTAIVPLMDKMEKVNLQIITMPIPAQDGITRDNVTVRVDAVIYYKVVDARRAAVDVEDYHLAVSQVAQTSLRSIIGQSELDDLLTNREQLNQGLAIMIDNPAVDWGIHIDRVEIKDVALPESMKRSMSRQAEAERERRSRIITADGELQASAKLAKAAEAMAHTPAALQLRLLQTIVEVASERNSTLVLPFPVELLRFLESNTVKNESVAKFTDAETSALGESNGNGPNASAADDSGATRTPPLEPDRLKEILSTLSQSGGLPESILPALADMAANQQVDTERLQDLFDASGASEDGSTTPEESRSKTQPHSGAQEGASKST
jgi:regulator of protease activity HflC (stomatin/prohibitin superfamily)